MNNFNDRRSTTGGKTSTSSEGSAEVRSAPSNRRVLPGSRSFTDFFAPEKQQRQVTRAEFLNLMGMLEWHRAESRWHRRIIRFFMGEPQVRDLVGALVHAHDETLKEAQKRMLAALDKEESHA